MHKYVTCVDLLTGHSVKGLFMHNWDEVDETGYCTAELEYTAVQNICQRLDIPCSKVTFVKEYWNDIFRYNQLIAMLFLYISI